MSLHALAGHMASKGRGSDSMLVHMTPEEVQSLQVLALKGGGTLTINPDTGLPEANFLKKMLPMIAGFALGPAGFGLMSAGMAGAAVGGITALSTGSLSRGLMAGLGAYGGASLGSSLMGAGAGTPAANAAALGVEGAATGVGSQAAMLAEQTAGFGAEGLSSLADSARVAVGAAPSKAGMLSAGFDAVTKSPETLGKFAKSNYGALAAAVSPMMAADTVQTTTKRPDTGMIRNFTFDPYGQTYSDAGSYPASEYKGMASGGIVALAAGGLTPEQARQMVEAQYATIGRSGVGTGANQIDQSGLQGWTDALVRGDFKAADLGSRFGAAVTDYMAQNPNDQYTQYVSQFKANQPAAAQPAAAGFTPFSASQINDYITNNNLDAAGITAATKQFNVDPNAVINARNAQETVSNIYRNVLGRDPDPVGLQYWTDQVTSGQRTGQEMYGDFLRTSQSLLGTAGAKEIFRPGISLEDAVKPFAGYSSADKRNIADEWVRNTLGREVTDADRQQQWYKDATNASSMSTYDAAQDIFGNFQNYARTAGQNANLGLGLFQASQLSPLAQPRITPATYAPEGTTNPYGNVTNPGDQTRNADGSITVQPNIPGRPSGGFTGMGQVKDVYTQGGGSLGYANRAPTTMEEFNKQTGDSLAAYNYLMGKGANPIKSGVEQIMRPYSEAVMGVPVAEGRPTQKFIFDPQTRRLVENPNYRPLSYNSKGERMVGLNRSEVLKGIQGLKDPTDDGALFDFVTDNRISEAQLAAALGIPVAEARARIAAGKKIKGVTTTAQGYDYGGGGGGDSGSSGSAGASGSGDAAGDAAAAAADGAAAAAGDGTGPGTGAGYSYGGRTRRMALGGLGALAGGGSTSQYNLGGYSDGGRLLRGPGDGVSDSIPATIGNKQPARLADGEFVVPARIVSELGNGSTEAGARKLYAMMDRVQKARGKTTGKKRVAVNTRSEKFLPA